MHSPMLPYWQVRVNLWARTLSFTFAAPHLRETHPHQLVLDFDDLAGCGTITHVPTPQDVPAPGSTKAAPVGDNVIDAYITGEAPDILSSAPPMKQNPTSSVNAPRKRGTEVGLELSWALRYTPRAYHAVPPPAPMPPKRSAQARDGGRGGSAYVAPGNGRAPAQAIAEVPAWAAVDIWPVEAARVGSRPWLRAGAVGPLDFTQCGALQHCRMISVVIR